VAHGPVVTGPIAIGPTQGHTLDGTVAISSTLDVDKSNHGNFTDPGEAGHASGTLTPGQSTVEPPYSWAPARTFWRRAKRSAGS
jgi:hypothetical protein